jgi:hypothetical protein
VKKFMQYTPRKRLHFGHRGGVRKPYVYMYAADWDRDSWNGISYTGNETHVPMIRMVFLRGWAGDQFNRMAKPVAKKYRKLLATKVLIGSLRKHYRGHKARRLIAALNRGAK